MRTYDIINAGPNNRFMANGKIVSNSGRIFQPQNLMRPTMDYAQIEEGIADVKSGIATLLHSNIPELLGNAVRGCVVAPPGKKLVCSDLSAIEGRALAWLADDERIVQFYRDADAGLVDYDSYMLAYTLVAGGDPAEVTDAERTIGKPIELAFGYGGGVGAFLTFAATYHLDLEALADTIWKLGDQWMLSECEDKYDWAKENDFHGGMDRRKYAAFEYTKQRWRAARQPTVTLWEQLGAAYRACILREGEVFTAGNDKIKLRRDGDWMRVRLPSGRCLNFIKPRLHEGDLTYMGVDQYTRKWTRLPIHGGKLAGIVTQAFARDILATNIPSVEEHGFNIVLSVHDELITEAPDEELWDAPLLSSLMTRSPSWAPGLPLNADGFETHRYRKE